MKNFERIIANQIAKVTQLNEEKLVTYIEIPKETKNGDYSFPCFKLAKELKKAPPIIANEIKEKLENDTISEIDKIDVVGGYLNFYINKETFVNEVLTEFANNQEYGKSNLGNNKKPQPKQGPGPTPRGEPPPNTTPAK